MKHRSRIGVLLCLIGIALFVILSAWNWPPKMALFPRVIGVFILLLSVADICFTLFGKGGPDETSLMDFRLSKDADQSLATRRILSVFLWTIGFLLGVVFLGFPMTALVFMFSYMKFDGKEGWKTTLIVTGVVWVSFYILFVRLLETQFPSGLIFEWIKGG
jgi:magnesium-transporting ATPase (P-type)